MKNKKIYRKTDDCIIAGVCAGLADYFEIDETLVRVIFVLLFIGGGSGLLIYLILWLVIPKEGKENKFIADFLNAIPKDEKGTADLKAGKVTLHDLFGAIPKNLKGAFYNYRGSLTTPPYTETVRWYITKHVFEASAAQIEAINKIEGNNARHVQALYGRKVSSN